MDVGAFLTANITLHLVMVFLLIQLMKFAKNLHFVINVSKSTLPVPVIQMLDTNGRKFILQVFILTSTAEMTLILELIIDVLDTFVNVIEFYQLG